MFFFAAPTYSVHDNLREHMHWFFVTAAYRCLSTGSKLFTWQIAFIVMFIDRYLPGFTTIYTFTCDVNHCIGCAIYLSANSNQVFIDETAPTIGI